MFDETRLAERLRVGFVFEGGQLFHHLTLGRNVALPLQYHRDLTDDEADREAQPLLELMELSPLAGALPMGVSRNWIKRAGLARALMLKPDVLLWTIRCADWIRGMPAGGWIFSTGCAAAMSG